MNRQPSRLMGTPDGGLISTSGFPDDGGTYIDIEPTTDTRGERVVRWVRGEHIYGRALSDPAPGAHLRGNQGWSLDDLADFWIEFISEGDLGAWLRGQRVDEDGAPLVRYVRIRHAWLAPLDGGVPPQRTGI